jgi:hypothetical protein
VVVVDVPRLPGLGDPPKFCGADFGGTTERSSAFRVAARRGRQGRNGSGHRSEAGCEGQRRNNGSGEERRTEGRSAEYGRTRSDGRKSGKEAIEEALRS